eukprot:TRINITY_DN2899_c0_g1_i2.p1 TRINITY_DN2899_c0_g1~~TRINITY_DN2899_c0_g1_i2.p1  ORF type:complete len:114 (-),score=5.98 TRINITY_DN2899_c0_g1_i2:270-611(-)
MNFLAPFVCGSHAASLSSLYSLFFLPISLPPVSALYPSLGLTQVVPFSTAYFVEQLSQHPPSHLIFSLVPALSPLVSQTFAICGRTGLSQDNRQMRQLLHFLNQVRGKKVQYR